MFLIHIVKCNLTTFSCVTVFGPFSFPYPDLSLQHVLTCVTPAGDVTVTGFFENSLFSSRQTGGKDLTAEWHAFSWQLVHGSRRQTDQGQVIIIALMVVVWMEDNLVHAVLCFIFLGDEGVVVSYSDFVLLGAVSISAERNQEMTHVKHS